MLLPDDVELTLIDSTAIAARVAELAATLNDDYEGSENLIVVGVLKGSFIFAADLTRLLTVPHQVDFVALSSYGDSAEHSGLVRLIMDTRLPLTGRDVLIVEDILDTGHTLDYLKRNFLSRGPKSVRSCVLLHKPSRQEAHVSIEYLGFEIPDVWVVGYGLDYADRYRTLPYIGVLKPSAYGR